MGKVDDLRALREARYGQQRDRRPIGLSSKEPVKRVPEAVAVPRPVQTPSPVPQESPAPSVDREEAEAPSPAAVPLENVDVKIGRPIQAYKDAELQAIVTGLYSPGMSADDMIDAVCVQLGFQRRGKIIKVRVREAFAQMAG